MAWVKVPVENQPLFLAALPRDERVETMKMFGGIAAKVNGNVFAGLFGLSTMIWLPESERAKALALKGAAPFEPMGNGVVSKDKIMLPVSMMKDAAALKRWVGVAFKAAAALPAKTAQKKTATAQKKTAQKKTARKKTP